MPIKASYMKVITVFTLLEMYPFRPVYTVLVGVHPYTHKKLQWALFETGLLNVLIK